MGFAGSSKITGTAKSASEGCVMLFARGEMGDQINYSKTDRWRSYRFYRALQRLTA